MERELVWKNHQRVIDYNTLALKIAMRNLSKVLVGLTLDDITVLDKVEGEETAVISFITEQANLYLGWGCYFEDGLTDEEISGIATWAIRAKLLLGMGRTYMGEPMVNRLAILSIIRDCVKVWADQGFKTKRWFEGIESIVVPSGEGVDYNGEDATTD